MSIVERAVGFAFCAHRAQRRKYTNEPYINHCVSVSHIVSQYIFGDAVACAAILHDVLEDTPVTYLELEDAFGVEIARLVEEVTDVSRPSDGKRSARKKIDREHLAQSSFEGASVKLADLIDNTSSIVRWDKDFARVYLAEKALLLPVLQHGQSRLWERAYETLQNAQEALVQHSLESKSTL